MSGSNLLRQGDIDALLRLIEDARHDDPGEAFPWELLQGLRRLIPCDYQIIYNNLDFREHRVVLSQYLDEEDRPGLDWQEAPDPEDEPFWDYFWESHCSYPQRTGDLRSVIQTADFHPTASDRARDPLSEILAGITHDMFVSMPAAPGQLRRILLRRAEDRAFSERDRQVLALLRPHLQEIWLDAERRRAGLPQLTPREWQVLGMAGAGLSYADIASALFVSIATVRKHMEHVRERLGVHSVMAAAAVALPHAPAQAVSSRRYRGTAPH